MIADSLACQDLVFYCDFSNSEDTVDLDIQVSGETYSLRRKCTDFFADEFDWQTEQKLLEDDTTAFARKYADKTFEVK